MGKQRSHEIINYRNKIMDRICKSEELVKLLGCENAEYPEDVIPYHKSYPHEYIPEVITKTERFINYELSATLDQKNNIYKDLTIYFFVVCHEEVIRYKEKGRTFLWYDKAVCELDEIFCDGEWLGVGEVKLVSNTPYSPHQKFKGRLLKFVAKDFNDGKKYGK